MRNGCPDDHRGQVGCCARAVSGHARIFLCKQAGG